MVKGVAQSKKSLNVSVKLKPSTVVTTSSADKSINFLGVCNEVLVWIASHDSVLPARVSHARSDVKRHEGLLRKTYDYTKGRTNNPPEVLRL